MGIELITVDAEERFLAALSGVEDPEKKRHAIGHTFIDVFEETAATGANGDFLVRARSIPT